LRDSFPPPSNVYHRLARFRDNEAWDTIHQHPLMRDRERVGRGAIPTAAIRDSQSVRTTEAAGLRGHAGGKRSSAARVRPRSIRMDGRAQAARSSRQCAGSRWRRAVGQASRPRVTAEIVTVRFKPNYVGPRARKLPHLKARLRQTAGDGSLKILRITPDYDSSFSETNRDLPIKRLTGVVTIRSVSGRWAILWKRTGNTFQGRPG
jgi:hypothetical protein